MVGVAHQNDTYHRKSRKYRKRARRLLAATLALVVAIALVVPTMLAYAARSDFKPGDLVVTTSPAGTTINLFDYWVDNRNAGDTQTGSATGWENSGINKNHSFKFSWGSVGGANGSAMNNYQQDENKGASQQGLVSPTLQNGYPQLSGTQATGGKTDSLAYLFNSSSQEGKLSFNNVTGLLSVDEQGYFGYDSTKNYAEFNEGLNSFSVVNKPAVAGTGGGVIKGEFFPFNPATDVFETDGKGNLRYDSNGELVADTTRGDDHVVLNHWFGMTMSTRFVQSTNGMLDDGTPVTYEFSGDDDVWVYIDGVLVGDLGGIHDKTSLKIDFQTGNVTVTNSNGTKVETTLKQAFQNAQDPAASNADAWSASQPNTFADGTFHTLDFFYLERGNGASNMSLKYNMEYVPETKIVKTDQDGNPVADATYRITSTNPFANFLNGALELLGFEDPITGTTDETGSFVLLDGDTPISVEQLQDVMGDKFYLEETDVPPGYRKHEPVKLKVQNGALVVEGDPSADGSRWQTGAHAQPTLATALGSDNLMGIDLQGRPYYFNLKEDGGTVFAVVLKRSSMDDPVGSDKNWSLVTGNAIDGWNVLPTTNRQDILDMAKAYANSGNVYTFQPASSGAMQAAIDNLPGDIATYYHMLEPADRDSAQYRIAYYYTTGSLAKADTSNTFLLNEDGDGTGNYPAFRQTYASTIYVTDLSIRLYLEKVDEFGKGLNGATFALYKAADLTVEDDGTWTVNNNAKPVSTQATKNQPKHHDLPAQDGIAVFEGQFSTGEYYLVETAAPSGHSKRPEAIPVLVSDEGVFVDAGESGDGVTVSNGVGHLGSGMVQFAKDANIDATLHDVKAALQTSSGTDENGFPAGWSEADFNGAGVMHLKFSDGSLNDYVPGITGGTTELTTDEGWSRLSVQQCRDHETPDETYKTDLAGVELQQLFSGETTVKVRNDKRAAMEVQKLVVDGEGDEVSSDDAFDFTLYVRKGYGNPGGATAYVFEENGDVVRDESGEPQKITVNVSGTDIANPENWGKTNFTLKAGQTLRVFGFSNTLIDWAVKETGVRVSGTEESVSLANSSYALQDIATTKEDPNAYFKANPDLDQGIVTCAMQGNQLNARATFKNEATLTDLTVAKSAEYDEGLYDPDPNAAFPFEVRFDRPVTEEEQGQITAKIGEQSLEFGEGEDCVWGADENGNSTLAFELKAGERVKFSGVPNGVGFAVAEDGVTADNTSLGNGWSYKGSTVQVGNGTKEPQENEDHSSRGTTNTSGVTVEVTNEYKTADTSIDYDALNIDVEKTYSVDEASEVGETTQKFSFYWQPESANAQGTLLSANEAGQWEDATDDLHAAKNAPATDDSLFDEGSLQFRFSLPGTYVYHLSEVRDGQAGVTYDLSTYHLYLKVKDKGDGTLEMDKANSKLEVTKETPDGSTGTPEEVDNPKLSEATSGNPVVAAFGNVYESGYTQVVINGKKVVQDADGNAVSSVDLSQFRFEAEYMGSDDTGDTSIPIGTIFSANANATTGSIEFSQTISESAVLDDINGAGKGSVTYKFEVREVGPDPSAPNAWYGGFAEHPAPVNVNVTFTKNSEGGLNPAEVTVVGTESSTFEFVNVYSATQDYAFTLKKNFTGEQQQAGDKAQLKIEAVDGGPLPENSDTVEVSGNAAMVTLGNPGQDGQTAVASQQVSLAFNQGHAGKTYNYTITESAIDPTRTDVEVSKASYSLSVSVADDGEGGLTVTPSWSKTTDDSGLAAQTSEVSGDTAAFTNYYPKPAWQQFTITKNLVGRPWQSDDSFTFSVNSIGSAPAPKTPTVTIQQGTSDHKALVETADITVADLIKAGATYDGNGQLTATFAYEIVEQDTEGLAEKGLTPDQSSQRVEFTVTRDTEGKLQVDPSPFSSTPINVTFTNRYAPNPTEVASSISVQKNIEGRDWMPGEEFAFQLKADGAKLGEATDFSAMPNQPMPAESTVKATEGNPQPSFGNITFDQPGSYRYTVTEQPGTLDTMHYSRAEWEAVLVVKDNLDGTLSIDEDASTIKQKLNDNGGTASGEAAGERPLSGASATFANSYTSTAVFAGLNAHKKLEGRDIKTVDDGQHGEFNYTVKAVDAAETETTSATSAEEAAAKAGWASGTTEQVVQSAAPGQNKRESTTQLLGSMQFGSQDAGKVYTYEVTEVVPSEGNPFQGVTYDTNSYTVAIVPYMDTDAPGWPMRAQVTVASRDGEATTQDSGSVAVQTVDFANVYKAGPTTPQSVADLGVDVKKTVRVEGESAEYPGGEFTFELSACDSQQNMNEAQAAIQQNSDLTMTLSPTGSGAEAVGEGDAFPDATLKFDSAGTYVYHVTEKIPAPAERQAGVSYDTSTWHLVVEVADNLQGQLVATAHLEKLGVAGESAGAGDEDAAERAGIAGASAAAGGNASSGAPAITAEFVNTYNMQAGSISLVGKKSFGDSPTTMSQQYAANKDYLTYEIEWLGYYDGTDTDAFADGEFSKGVADGENPEPASKDGNIIANGEISFGSITFSNPSGNPRYAGYKITETIPDDATNPKVNNGATTYRQATESQKATAGWTYRGITYDMSTWTVVVKVEQVAEQGSPGEEGYVAAHVSAIVHKMIKNRGEQGEEVQDPGAFGNNGSGLPYSFEFQNVYSATGQGTVQVTKDISGRPWQGFDNYTFTLKPAENDNGEMSPFPEGYPDGMTIRGLSAGSHTATSGSIPFTKAGTYKYELTENDVSVPGISKDGETRYVYIVMEDKDHTGTLTQTNAGATSGDAPNGAAFTNTYDATPASATISVNKTMNRAWLEGEEYAFTLKPASWDPDAPLPEGGNGSLSATVEATAGGTGTLSASFPQIDYDQTGTFYYEITEDEFAQDEHPGVTRDEKKVYVRVDVTDDYADGSYTVTVLYGTTAGTGNTYGTAIPPFENKYQAESLSLELTDYVDVGKFVTELGESSYGNVPEEGKSFSFTLEPCESATPEQQQVAMEALHNGDEHGESVQAAQKVESAVGSADAATPVAGFDNVHFEFAAAGTYRYDITEDQPEGESRVAGMNYSNDNYHLEFSVTDNTATGKLEATVKLLKNSESIGADNIPSGSPAGAVFENVFDLTQGTLNLNGSKKWDGDAPVGDMAGKYAFKVEAFESDGVTPDSDAPLPEPATAITLANGQASFGTIKFDSAHAGQKYIYKVTEVRPSEDDANYNAGVTYDDTAWYYSVMVTENDGVMTATVTQTQHKDAQSTVIDGEEWSQYQPFAFTNKYATSGTLAANAIQVTKSITGADRGWLADDSFSFQITGTSSGAPLPGGVGTSPVEAIVDADTPNHTTGFAEITFTKPGTYTYEVTERDDSGASNHKKDGMAWSQERYEVTVQATDQGDGSMDVRIASVKRVRDEDGSIVDASQQSKPVGDPLAFNNRYQPDPVNTNLQAMGVSVHKTLAVAEGSDPFKGGDFRFRIEGKDEASKAAFSGTEGYAQTTLSMGEVAAGAQSENQEVQLTQGVYLFSFREKGTYTYDIYELNDHVQGVGYDDTTRYTLTVEVTDDGKNQLEIDQAQTGLSPQPQPLPDGAAGTGAQFVNSFNVAQTEAYSRGYKLLNGSQGIPEGFEGRFKVELRPTGDNAATAPMPGNSDTCQTTGEGENRVSLTTADASALFTSGMIAYGRDCIPAGQTSTAFTYEVREHVPDGATNAQYDNVTWGGVGDTQEATEDQKKTRGWTYEGVTYDTSVWNVTIPVQLDLSNNAVVASISSVTKPVDHEPSLSPDLVQSQGKGQYNYGYQFAFANTYAAKGTLAGSTQLVVEKALTGRPGDAWLDTDEFSFKLTPDAANPDAPMPEDEEGNVVDTLTIDDTSEGAGTAGDPKHASFGDIEYTQVGEYLYTISEVVPDDAQGNVKDGIAYSQAKYQVKVTASDTKHNGELDVEREIVPLADDEGGEGEVASAPAAAAFTNKYAPEPLIEPMSGETGLGVGVKKTLNNVGVKEGEGDPESYDGGTFAFALVPNAASADAQGTVVKVNGATEETLEQGTASVDIGTVAPSASASGTGTFDASLKFTHEGTYVYDIYEENGEEPGVHYDTARYTLTVEVKDNADGTLRVESATVSGDDGKVAAFSNDFDMRSTTLPIVGKKLVNGEVTGDFAGKFSFTLAAGDNDTPMPGGSVDGTVERPVGGSDEERNDAAGDVAFGDVIYKVDDIEGTATPGAPVTKEFTYTVTEGALPEALEGSVTPDASTWEITVAVTKHVDDKDATWVTAAVTKAVCKVDGAVVTTYEPEDPGVSADLGLGLYGSYAYGFQFDNAYDPKGTLVGAEALQVSKLFTGRTDEDGAWLDTDEFSFKLTPDTANPDAPMPEDGSGGTKDETTIKASDDSAHDGVTVPKVGCFGDIEYRLADVGKTYYYTITEVAPSDAQGNVKDGITYSQASYQVAVTITNPQGTSSALVVESTMSKKLDDAGGYASGTVADDTAAFANTYAAEPVTGELGETGSTGLGLTIKKQVEVTDGTLPGETFEFVVRGEDAASKATMPNGEPVTEGIKIDGGATKDDAWSSGIVNSQAVFTYNEAGTYTYTVSEAPGTTPGMSYSKDVYTLTVEVGDDTDGKLYVKSHTLVKTEGEDAGGALADGTATFTNTYGVTTEPMELKGYVALNGEKDTTKYSSDFEDFQVRLSADEPGVPMPDGYASHPDGVYTIGANGEVDFGGITFRPEHARLDPYVYKIEHVAGSNKGIDYDDAEWTVEVTVKSETVSGTNAVAVTTSVVIKKNGEVVDDGSDQHPGAGYHFGFNDVYSAGATVDVPVQKTLTGRDWSEGENEFTFKLQEAEGMGGDAPMPNPDTITIGADSVFVPGSTDTKQGAFAVAGFASAAVTDGWSEIYSYIVSEQGTSANGLTYSGAAWQVDVTLTDPSHDGTLSAEVATKPLAKDDGTEAQGSQSKPAGEQPVTFVNRFVEPVSADIQAKKRLVSGATPVGALDADAFGFTLTQLAYNVEEGEWVEAEGAPTATARNAAPAAGGDGTGAIVFDGSEVENGMLSYDQTRLAADVQTGKATVDDTGTYPVYTYAYQMTEDDTDKLAGKGMEITDGRDGYVIYVKVADTGTALQTEVVYPEDGGATSMPPTFTNVEYGTAQAQLAVSKDFIGGLPADADPAGKFSFTLSRDGQQVGPAAPLVKNGDAYEASFEPITYSYADLAGNDSVEFVYTITESGYLPYVANDDGAHEVTVQLTKNSATGTLDARVIDGSGLAFANVYTDPEGVTGRFPVSVAKVLNTPEGATGAPALGDFSYLVSLPFRSQPVTLPAGADGRAQANIEVTRAELDQAIANGVSGVSFDEVEQAYTFTVTLTEQDDVKTVNTDYDQSAYAFTVKATLVDTSGNAVAASIGDAGGLGAQPEALGANAELAPVAGTTVLPDATALRMEVLDGPIEVTFTNTYHQPDTKVDLDLNDAATAPRGTKVLEAKDGKDYALPDIAGKFTFKVMDGSTVVAEGTNTADGSIRFDNDLHYTLADLVVDGQIESPRTFTYRVVEEGHVHGVVNGANESILEVVVSYDSKSGALTATASTFRFVNVYDPGDPVSVSLTARKMLFGRALQAGEFTFSLTNEDGSKVLVANAPNAADGSVSFGQVPLSEPGTYVFVASEQSGMVENVTYDQRQLRVQVTVGLQHDEATGTDKLAVENVSYPDGELVFTNRYVQSDEAVRLAGGSGSDAVKSLVRTGDSVSVAVSVLAGVALAVAASAASITVRHRRKHR